MNYVNMHLEYSTKVKLIIKKMKKRREKKETQKQTTQNHDFNMQWIIFLLIKSFVYEHVRA